MSSSLCQRVGGLGVLSLMAAMIWAGAVPTGPAHGAVIEVLCPLGSQTVTYNPGLTNTPSQVTVTWDLRLDSCVSLTHPAVTSGGGSGNVVRTGSCSEIVGSSTGSQVITWNTGQTSTFSFTRTYSSVNGEAVLLLTGTITSGLFYGASAVLTIVDATLDLAACNTTTGLTQINGVTDFVAS